MSDQSRRDVLGMLASSMILPEIPDGTNIEGGRSLADVDDAAIWLAPSVAVASDYLDGVIEGVEPIARTYDIPDSDLSRKYVRELVLRAACGDFSAREEYIHRRATETLYCVE